MGIKTALVDLYQQISEFSPDTFSGFWVNLLIVRPIFILFGVIGKKRELSNPNLSWLG